MDLVQWNLFIVSHFALHFHWNIFPTILRIPPFLLQDVGQLAGKININNFSLLLALAFEALNNNRNLLSLQFTSFKLIYHINHPRSENKHNLVILKSSSNFLSLVYSNLSLIFREFFFPSLNRDLWSICIFISCMFIVSSLTVEFFKVYSGRINVLI